MELGVSVKDVRAMVIGGHADTMVPLPEFSTVSGVPITKLLSKSKINAIINRTKHAGAEIVALLKTGSAYYAPSRAVSEMAESIIRDQKRVIPSAVYAGGAYGVKDMFIGLPAVLGAGGVEHIVKLKLDDEEKKEFKASVKAIKTLLGHLDI